LDYCRKHYPLFRQALLMILSKTAMIAITKRM
jgi:hypothetical protein